MLNIAFIPSHISIVNDSLNNGNVFHSGNLHVMFSIFILMYIMFVLGTSFKYQYQNFTDETDTVLRLTDLIPSGARKCVNDRFDQALIGPC